MCEFKKNAIESLDSMAKLFTDLSDKIWDQPELSLKEHKAAELYIKTLKELGFELTENLGGIKTAFCGRYGKGRPVIGILGEYDALDAMSQKAGLCHPEMVVDGGCGHGCGHNLLGAGSLAAAVAVKDFLEKSGREGTVVFYGCPGEEGCASKAFLARERIWKELDAALCWHPSDVNQVRTGTNNSSLQVLYKFKGVAAHAAGDPYNGRSALDAVELMNIGVQFLREHMSEECRIHYAITDAGGCSPNVVQAKADVLYMVRANRVADSVKLLKRVDDIAKGAALMSGTEFDRIFIDGTADILPNYALEELLYKNFQEISLPEYSDADMSFAQNLRATYYHGDHIPGGIGAKFDRSIAKRVSELTDGGKKALNDFIMPLYSGTGFIPGSSDVGDVSWLTPTAQIETVTWPADIPGHSWQVVSCGKSEIAHKGLLMAGKVLAATAIDLLTSPELLKEARAEFEEKAKSGYVCPIEPDAVPMVL